MTVAADAFFSAESLQDPYPLYERMRAAGPVHRIGDSGFYAVCDWDAINDVINRPEDFSSNLTATMTYTPEGAVKAFEMDALGGPTHVLATADDPAHAIHRKLLARHLAARRIGALERFATQTAERLWSDGLRDGRIEWMGAMANRLPMMVVAELIGVPDVDVAKLEQWGYAATQFVEGLVSEEQLAAAGVSVMELSGYIGEQFARATDDPQDNLLGKLARACASGELDSFAAQAMLVILFAAGGESTASLLGSAAWMLAQRPDVQRQLRERPELLAAFIEETLRYEPPFRGHYRHVRNDATLGGVDLPAGSRLLLLWGGGQPGPGSLRDARRVPPRPGRSQGAHQLRKGSALLRRRRPGTPGGTDRVAPAVGSHIGDRGGRRGPVAAEHPGAPPGPARAGRGLKRLISQSFRWR